VYRRTQHHHLILKNLRISLTCCTYTFGRIIIQGRKQRLTNCYIIIPFSQPFTCFKKN
jgi:hypothetical protein